MEFTITEGNNKAVIKTNDKGIVLIQFYYKDSPAKSKKGNLNMAWCSSSMFEKIVEKYIELTVNSKEEEDDEIDF